MLLKEYRYLAHVGSQTHILHVHELVSGDAGWGGKFRLQIPANTTGAAQTIYGGSAEEVAQKGYAFLNRGQPYN